MKTRTERFLKTWRKYIRKGVSDRMVDAEEVCDVLLSLVKEEKYAWMFDKFTNDELLRTANIIQDVMERDDLTKRERKFWFRLFGGIEEHFDMGDEQ